MAQRPVLWLFGGLALVAVGALVISHIPDIVRYIKIERM